MDAVSAGNAAGAVLHASAAHPDTATRRGPVRLSAAARTARPARRRDLMLLLAAGTASALGVPTLAACSSSPSASDGQASGATSASPTQASPSGPATAQQASPSPSRDPLFLQEGPPTLPEPPGPEPVIYSLPPETGNVVALTIDDGADAAVIDAYLDFCQASGVRLTFFVTSQYPGWEQCRDKMLPLVESGQVQLGNHTVTHAGLTTLSDAGVAEEVSGCESFLTSTFGVTGTPFVRPPYGYRDARTDAVCASLGYTSTAMWEGSFGDSGLLTEDVLLGEARKWLEAGRVVIGHANFPTVTHLYGQILDILRERSLLTATLDDVYLGPGHSRAA